MNGKIEEVARAAKQVAGAVVKKINRLEEKILKFAAKLFSGFAKAYQVANSSKLDEFLKELNELRRDPNLYYDGKKLASYVSKINPDIYDLKHLVSHLRSHDPRFKEDSEELEKFLMHLPKPATAHKIVGHITSRRWQKNSSKRAKKLAPYLVGLVKRPRAENTLFSQEAIRVKKEKNTFIVDKGFAISAALQSSQPVRGLANLQTVFINKGDVLCTRSSRSNTQESIKEKSIADIAARIEKGGAIKTYSRADCYFLDWSETKSLLMRVRGYLRRFKKAITPTWRSQLKFFTHTEFDDERKFCKKKMHAYGELWKDNESTIIHTIKVNNEEYTVDESRPYVLNFLFSGFSKSKDNVRAARRMNLPEMARLCKNYLKQKLEALNPGETIKSIEGFAENPSADNLNKFRENLNALSVRLDLDAEDSEKALVLMSCLEACLTGSLQGFGSFDRPEDQIRIFGMTALLLDEMGTPMTVECKSGNDRTQTAVGVLSAIEAFKTEKQTLPSFVEEKDIEFMRKHFLESVNTLGAANVTASRGIHSDGKPLLKVKSHPSFDFMLPRDEKGKVVYPEKVII